MNAVTPQRAGRREWIGLTVLMLPTLLIVMDLTVLHLAVPHLSEELAPTSAQLLWIVDIYGFLIAGSLITMGTLGDRIGRRKLLMIGAAAFGVASVLAAFSPSAELLIASRALLGVAGATLMPSTLALIRNMFLDPKQRSVAIGIWVSGFSAGSAIGPLIGGALLEYFWWGSVFLLGVPVMAAAAGAGAAPAARAPRSACRQARPGQRCALAGRGAAGDLRPQADRPGWPGDAVQALSILVGLGLGVAFVRRQRTLADPLIDLRLFRIPAFSVALATYTLGVFVAFGSFLFVAQYLQLVLGLSPLQAGLWSVPGALASIIGSNVAPVLVRHVRPAFVVAGGLVLATIGFALITMVGASSLMLIVVGSFIMSIGFGFTFTVSTDLVMGTAPPERAGAASAITETGAELGGALGIAMLGSLGMAVYRSQLASTMPPGLPPEAARCRAGNAWQRCGDGRAAPQPARRHAARCGPRGVHPGSPADRDHRRRGHGRPGPPNRGRAAPCGNKPGGP